MGVSVILLLGALSWYVTYDPEEGIYCPSPVHDFGRIEVGAELHHDFRLINGSGKTIGPLQVFAGCASCSSTVLDRETLAPGEEALLRVTLKVAEPSGEIVKRFVVGDRRGSGGRRIYAEIVAKAHCEPVNENQ